MLSDEDLDEQERAQLHLENEVGVRAWGRVWGRGRGKGRGKGRGRGRGRGRGKGRARVKGQG